MAVNGSQIQSTRRRTDRIKSGHSRVRWRGSKGGRCDRGIAFNQSRLYAPETPCSPAPCDPSFITRVNNNNHIIPRYGTIQQHNPRRLVQEVTSFMPNGSSLLKHPVRLCDRRAAHWRKLDGDCGHWRDRYDTPRRRTHRAREAPLFVPARQQHVGDRAKTSLCCSATVPT